jgi:hypothetical protein
MWSVGGGVKYIPATFDAEEGARKGLAKASANKGGIPDWGTRRLLPARAVTGGAAGSVPHVVKASPWTGWLRIVLMGRVRA